MVVETDIVLSAIRRGEDSLPKLRAATGLEYAKLHVELHKLEFEWKSIQRFETADGFSRYAPTPSESTNGGSKGVHWSAEQPIPPAAFVQSKLGLAAREISIIQRDAPYCTTCRGLCFVNGTNEGRVQWRCRTCSESFDGSLMGRIDPLPEPVEQKPKVSIMRPREELGPDEEAAIEAMRVRTDHPTIGDEEEAALAAMRGGELSEDEARIAEEIDRELAEVDNDEARCGCGYTANHRGRCADGQKKSARQDSVLTHCEKCGKSLAGQKKINMNRCSACWSVYLKDCAGKRKAKAAPNGHVARSGQNITETITTLPEIPTAKMEPKEAMAGSEKIIPRNIPMAQVQVMGSTKFREDVEVRLSEMREWPAERVSEFFDALSKIIEIPHRPLPTAIKPAWSPDFEGQVGDPEGSVGITTFYLISMLHHNMEPHEKEAVWTLVQYLKRMEAYVEQEKARTG